MLFGMGLKNNNKKVMVSNLIVMNNQVIFNASEKISKILLEDGRKRFELKLFFDEDSQKYMLDLSDLTEQVTRNGKFTMLAEVAGTVKKISRVEGPSLLTYETVNTVLEDDNKQVALWFSDYNNLLLLAFPEATFDSDFLATKQGNDLSLTKKLTVVGNKLQFSLENPITLNKFVLKNHREEVVFEGQVTQATDVINIDVNDLSQVDLNQKYDLFVVDTDMNEYRLIDTEMGKKNTVSRHVNVMTNLTNVPVYVYYTPTGRISVASFVEPVEVRKIDTPYTVTEMTLIDDNIVLFDREFAAVGMYDRNNYVFADVQMNGKELRVDGLSDPRNEYILFVKVKSTSDWTPLHAETIINDGQNMALYDANYVFLQPKSTLKLTSIVTFYNTEEYLPKTFGSLVPEVQGLGVSEYEVLMVNDGSTDNGAEIAQAFADKYENFRLINQENKGLGGARNTGISEAQGQYIAFVDGDDFLPENTYHDMIDSAFETGSEVVTGEVLRFKNGHTSVSLAYRQSHITDYKAVKFEDVPELVHDTTAWNKLFKKDFFLKQGLMYPERLYEDMEISIKMLQNANHIDILSRPVYYWLIRDTQGNASITNSREKVSNFTDRMVGVHAIHDFLEDNDVLRTSYEKKVLEIDMPMYIKRFPAVTADYQAEIVKEVQWILASFTEESLNTLSYIEKVQYSLLSNNEIKEFVSFQTKVNENKLTISVNERGEISSPYNDILYLNRPKFTISDIVGTLDVVDVMLVNNQVSIKLNNSLKLFGATPQIDQVSIASKEGHALIATEMEASEAEADVLFRFPISKLMNIVKNDALNLLVTIDGVTVSILTTVKNDNLMQGIGLSNNDTYYGLGKNKNHRLIGVSRQLNPIESFEIASGVIRIQYIENHELVILDENKNALAMQADNNIYRIDLRKMLALTGEEFTVFDKTTGISVDLPRVYQQLDNQVMFSSVNNVGVSTLVISENFAELQNVGLVDNTIELEMLIDKNESENLTITLVDDFGLVRSRGRITGVTNTNETSKVMNITLPVDNENIVNDDELHLSVLRESGTALPVRTMSLMNDTLMNEMDISLRIGLNVNHALGELALSKAPVVSEVTGKNLKTLSNFKNTTLVEGTDYTRNLEHEDIQENTIFYESFYGQLFTDNPFGVFKYVLDRDPEKKYTHVWVVKDHENTVQRRRFSHLENVIFVQYNSAEYRYYLAVSKYIVMNTSTVQYFAPRKEQRVLQAWHGIPLKALGTDSNMTRGANRNVIRSFAEATHYLNPNVYTDKKVVDTLDLKDISNAKRMIGSYPRWERVMNAAKEGYKENVLAKVVNIDPKKKLVLYAPTWRGENGKVQDASGKFIENYNLMRRALPSNYELVMKVHENAYKQMVKGYDVSKINFVPHYLDASEILSVTDLLVSDYSSIIFDYAITGRPVIEYMYDLDEYAKVSGFYTEILTKLPGKIIKSADDLFNNLSTSAFENDTYNLGDLVTYNQPSLDAMMSEFFDSSVIPTESTTDVVIYAVRHNQITRRPEEFAAHINKLAESQTIALYHVDQYSKDDVDFFENLDANVRHFYKVGEPDIQPAEYLAVQKFGNDEELSEFDRDMLAKFIQREMRREFGNINIKKFDAMYEVSKNDYNLYTVINFK